MKEEIIVFGTGNFMRERISYISNKYEVVFFCDNDNSKWHMEINNKKIINPAELNKYKWDYILIASSSRIEISKQLSKLGIEESKMLIFEDYISYKIVNKGFYPQITGNEKDPEIRKIDDTINEIVRERASLCRFGDGEFLLMSGMVGPKFQKYNEELANRLREIIKSNEENILIGIPNVFDSLDQYTDFAKVYWKSILEIYKEEWLGFINNKKKYENTCITRPYIDYKDKSNSIHRFNNVKRIWDERDIIIVEGDKSRLGVGNDLFSNCKSINRILCPSKDAYEFYGKILDITVKQDKEKLILIALGPTATVLAYDLSRLGYQAIDIGHIDIEYEWFLNKSIEREKIQGKYVNEITEGDIVSEINNDLYINEIIQRIF